MTAAERNSRLEADGFVVLDLLTSDEVQFLNALCDRFLGSAAGEFVSSSHFLPEADSRNINRELHRIIRPKMEASFPGLDLLGGTLGTKKRGKSTLKAHNDWTIVDESHYNSYNLWIPLVDAGKSNGTLGMIPGSHKWPVLTRGLNLPNPFEQFTDRFLEIGFEPELRAGQAVLYNHKLIHYSRPNRTAMPRNVAIIGLKDKGAELQVTFSHDGISQETYAAGEGDFYAFDPQKIKAGNKLLKTEPVVIRAPGWDEVLAWYKAVLPPGYVMPERKKTIFVRLREYFGPYFRQID